MIFNVLEIIPNKHLKKLTLPLQNSTAMALIHSFEKSGNWLFKHRGELPVVLFLTAVPVVYFTEISWLTTTKQHLISWIAAFLSVLGFVIRAISIGTTPKGTSGRIRKPVLDWD